MCSIPVALVSIILSFFSKKKKKKKKKKSIWKKKKRNKNKRVYSFINDDSALTAKSPRPI